MTAAKPSFPAPPHGTLASGLSLGLPLYEGGGLTVNDLSGNGNNGTLNGGVTWVDGPFGKCLSFDGSSGYISVPNSASFNSFPGITLAAWVYAAGFNATDANQVIVKSTTASGVSDPYELFGFSVNGSAPHHVNFDISTGVAGTRVSLNSAGLIALNTWCFLACTYDGSVMRIYVNGAADPNTASTTLAIGNNNNPVLIGRYSDTGLYNDFWQGQIDAPLIFNRALSPAEIAALYADSFKMYRRSRTVFKAAAGGTTADMAGTANGSATVAGVLAALAAAGGTCSVAPSVAGAGAALAVTAGAASGSAVVLAGGAALAGTAGGATGVATISGVGVALAVTGGAASGAGTASGGGAAKADATGAMTGAGTASAGSQALAAAAGSVAPLVTVGGVFIARADFGGLCSVACAVAGVLSGGNVTGNGGTFTEYPRGVVFREWARAATFLEYSRGTTFRAFEINGAPAMLDTLPKRDGESLNYTFDFTRLPALQAAGVTLSAVSSVTGSVNYGTGDPLTIGSGSIGTDNKSVKALISGGTTGAKYLLKAKATTSDGQTVQCNGLLDVTDS